MGALPIPVRAQERKYTSVERQSVITLRCCGCRRGIAALLAAQPIWGSLRLCDENGRSPRRRPRGAELS